METSFVVIIIISHLSASLPFWLRIRHGLLPTTVDFATASVVLFYDMGLILELIGYTADGASFELLSYADPEILQKSLIVLALAPWLIRIGSFISNRGKVAIGHIAIQGIQKSKRSYFYAFAVIASSLLAVYGLRLVMQWDSIWSARYNISTDFGPYIIILYLPIQILAFYIQQTDSRTRAGFMFSAWLIVTCILSTLAVGERTMILLPFLMMAIFATKLTLKKVAIYAMVGIVLASTLLSVFKFQYSDTNYSTGELVAQTIYSDLSRGPVLAVALRMTEPVGSKIMPYPMSGFVYSLFFFVPRDIASFKGYATADFFTSALIGTPVDELDWGFGVGAIEEILLNCGFWFYFPVLILYGLIFGILDRFSKRVQSLVLPTRLAGLWICGYHLPAVLLVFGAMAIVNYFLHRLFVNTRAGEANITNIDDQILSASPFQFKGAV